MNIDDDDDAAHRAGQLDAVIQERRRLNQPSGAFREHNGLSPLPPPKKRRNYITEGHQWELGIGYDTSRLRPLDKNVGRTAFLPPRVSRERSPEDHMTPSGFFFESAVVAVAECFCLFVITSVMRRRAHPD